jgi:hypothetical protein
MYSKLPILIVGKFYIFDQLKVYLIKKDKL